MKNKRFKDYRGLNVYLCLQRFKIFLLSNNALDKRGLSHRHSYSLQV